MKQEKLRVPSDRSEKHLLESAPSIAIEMLDR